MGPWQRNATAALPTSAKVPFPAPATTFWCKWHGRRTLPPSFPPPGLAEGRTNHKTGHNCAERVSYPPLNCCKIQNPELKFQLVPLCHGGKPSTFTQLDLSEFGFWKPLALCPRKSARAFALALALLDRLLASTVYVQDKAPPQL